MSLAVGAALGPYTILAPLGAGGMGEVYRARDTRLGRDVAIKVLPSDVAQDPARLERFAREARAAAALNHPNILAVHDVSATGHVHYLVSELLEGQTLAERLQASAGALSVRKAVDLAQQIAQGLGAAHARGIVHRDLKPANIFVTSDGRAKILDFGLAKDMAGRTVAGLTTTGATREPQTDPGQVLGTVGYMAPEQVRGQTLDARADIFPFGAVLYEMLAGRRAFQADTAADTISAILGKDPPDLVSVPEHVIPPALLRIVARCLEKDPAARFQSAADLAFALQALTSDSGATPSGVNPLDAGAIGSTAARGRWRDAVLVVLAISGLGSAGAMLLRRPAPPLAPAEAAAQFDVALPVGVSANDVSMLTLSPDGRWLLISTASQLWLRSLADTTATRVGPPQSPALSAWAPDSSEFVYLVGGRLMRYQLSDRSTSTVGEPGPLTFPATAAWSSRGDLLLADGKGRLLQVTVANFASSLRVLDKGGGVGRGLVGFLPGSSTYLFVRNAGPPATVGLFSATLEGSEEHRIDDGAWQSGAVVDGSTVLLKRGTAIYERRLPAGSTPSAGAARLLVADARPTAISWSVSSNGVLKGIMPSPRARSNIGLCQSHGV